MDPDACLKRFWRAVKDGDWEEAREARSDLQGWLNRGGFAPDWKKSGHTRADFMSFPLR